MTLEQLRIFLAVAEQEHVTRASYELDMVQSAVSKAIAALEGETAMRLFDRVGRNIRLTPLGAEFQGRARDLLDHAARFETWTQGVGTRVGRSAIGCTPKASASKVADQARPITGRDESDRIRDARICRAASGEG